MRMPRIKADGEGYYHIISRTIGGQMLFDAQEKERFRRYMRQSEAFAGVNVLTYAILGNHFHILLHVPRRRELSDEELTARLGHLYAERTVKSIAHSLSALRERGANEQAERLKHRYTRRMYDLSEYMKTVKQRFSQSYNRRHGRKGTLWEEQRFKSVLLQGRNHAVALVGAYVDLNAVRAGLVDDPRDYRFCGYGEAVGGSRQAREGVAAIAAALGTEPSWPQAVARYRQWLYLRGEVRGLRDDGRPLRRGFDPEQVQAVIDAGGELSVGEMLRCRIRYLTDGLVLGSQAFVENARTRYGGHFSARARAAACGIRGDGWGELYTARSLRAQAIVAVEGSG